jgi:pyroglutamyl-peptidase
MTVLITGFGPFPGAPFNPTAPLARALERTRPRGHGDMRRVAHVFEVSYEAVDRDLPALLAGEQPDVLVMFGLAARTRHMRIETCARNVVSRALPDVGGKIPSSAVIAPGAPAVLPLCGQAPRLLVAARSTGIAAALSRDAGRYLCNYLCWRAAEAAGSGGPRLVAFIHVPAVPRLQAAKAVSALSLAELTQAGEAIVRAAAMAARWAAASAVSAAATTT